MPFTNRFDGSVEVKVKDRASLSEATAFFQQNQGHHGACLSIVSDFERIIENDGQDLDPYLDEQKCAALIDALQTTSTPIRFLLLDADLLESTISAATASRLCSVIGNIPTLEVLYYLGTETTTAPRGQSMQRLSRFLHCAKKLATLSIVGETFDGNMEDFEYLAAALTNHPHLKDISLSTAAVNPRNQNLVLSALATVPNLKSLKLGPLAPFASENGSTDSFATLAQVCGHPCLEELSLGRFKAGPGPLSAFAALRHSLSLKILSLNIECEEEECRQVGEILRANQVIERVTIIVHPFQCDQHAKLIVAGLEENRSVKRLSFIFAYGTKYFSTEVQNVLVAALRNNLTLCDLDFGLVSNAQERFNANLDTVKTMQHYVKMNRRGRKALLDNTNAPRKQWINALVSSRNSTEGLFYLLSKKPNLCDLNQGSDDESIPHRKKRQRLWYPSNNTRQSWLESDAESDNDM